MGIVGGKEEKGGERFLFCSSKKGHTYMRNLTGSHNTREVGNPELVKVRGDCTQLPQKLLPANAQKNSAFYLPGGTQNLGLREPTIATGYLAISHILLAGGVSGASHSMFKNKASKSWLLGSQTKI